MRRHKQYYFEPTDNPSINRIIIIMRKPKPQSRIRKIMWRAATIKWDTAVYKKYNIL